MLHKRRYCLIRLQFVMAAFLGIIAGMALLAEAARAADELVISAKTLKINNTQDKADVTLKEDGVLSFVQNPELVLNLGKVVLSGHGAGISFDQPGYRQAVIDLLVAEKSGRFVFKADYSSGKADYLIIEDSIDDNPEQIAVIKVQSAAGLGTAEVIPLVLDKSKKLVFVLDRGRESIKMGDFLYKLTPTVDENGVNWALHKTW